MAIEGLIHIILFLMEDAFVWLGLKAGMNFWTIILISLFVFFFFYRQIFAFFRGILRRVGI
tara:strand:- start:1327 stop:1509 length:183 start_codon:yes stop_codon:yes gene_type:complete